MMKSIKHAIPVLAVALSCLLAASGCKKPSAPTNNPPSTATGASSSSPKWITDTEQKEREDLQVSIVTIALAGDFQKLESMAADYRTNEVRFRNGSWKLGIFYSAFGSDENLPDEAHYLNLIGQLEKWAAAEPRSVTPRLALVEAYHGFAWMARGSDNANTVSDAQWQTMAERLKKCFSWLAQTHGLAKDPALYTITLHSYLGANVSPETYEKVFAAGVQNAPGYQSLYVAKSYYLLPRWYGKPGEWEQFARAMTARNNLLHHEEIFARVALYLRELGYFYEEFSNDPTAWEELKTSFRALEKNYPDSLEIKSSFCITATKLYDFKAAREQMQLLDGQVDLSVWHSQDNYLTAVQWLNQDDATLEAQQKQFQAQPH
jgi:hypothetical protein